MYGCDLYLLFCDHSINDHGYCAENLLDTIVRKSLSVDIVDDCGRYCMYACCYRIIVCMCVCVCARVCVTYMCVCVCV